MKTNITEEGITEINGIAINEKIFNEEKVDYALRDREELINDLIEWIAECKNSDRLIMKEDLKYLLGLDDEYVFSSISTNEFIALSDDEEEFNKICEEILKLNEEIKK